LDCNASNAIVDNIDGEELEQKLRDLVECKWKEVKSGPEIVIGDWKIDIKDQAYNVIRMIIAFQQIIGDAISAEPHAALAWTGVVAILPVSIKSCYLLYLSTLHKILTPAFQLLLNPVKQTDDAEKGLNCIT
jgi:hypothetical protein